MLRFANESHQKEKLNTCKTDWGCKSITINYCQSIILISKVKISFRISIETIRVGFARCKEQIQIPVIKIHPWEARTHRKTDSIGRENWWDAKWEIETEYRNLKICRLVKLN